MKARTTALADAKVREAILAHAAAEAPRECCGLVLRTRGRRLRYQPARNLHEGAAGEDRFVLDPQVWTDVDDAGAEPVAVVHSHPSASANPSMADRVMCERSGLPWVIVGWPSGAFVELQPDGWAAPLEGREFCFGVLDCYTLVQDWYARELAVELPDFARDDGFWERKTLPDGTAQEPQDLYREGLAEAGFRVVATTEPQRGDGLLMRVASPEVDNHAAVYLGDGYMLHHLYGQLSRRERWDWPWQRRTMAIVRHRSMQ